MRKAFSLVAVATMALAMFSCNKEMTVAPQVEDNNNSAVTNVVTKAYGDKTPKMFVYVETNDVNPVNALDYYLSDGSQFFDVVELFAANINVDGNGDPCIYFNDKLAPVMADTTTYIRPLQNAGIKVLLTLLPNWQNMGLCTMTDEQASMLAEIAAYVVNEYGLDGIGLDDEYEGTNYTTVSGSYGNFISYLRTYLGSDKLITSFAYGHIGSSQIGSTAGGYLDYAYTNFTYTSLNTTPDISGVTTARWAPMSINLSYSYGTTARSYMKSNATTLANGGYAGVMFFNLPKYSTRNCVPVFTAVAEGAYNKTVYVSGGNRTRATATAGVTITYNDI